MTMLLYSSYTELSCPSGIVRCNVKELVQLVDWSQSWYAEGNSHNKDRPQMGNPLLVLCVHACVRVCVCVCVCVDDIQLTCSIWFHDR